MLNSRIKIAATYRSRTRLTDLIFDSQLIIAVSSTSLAAETFFLCSIPINFRLLGLIFFSTLLLYNLAHLRIELQSLFNEILADKSIHGVLVKFSAVALLPFMIDAVWTELLLYSLLGFAALAYVMPFVQNDAKVRGLRNVPALKNIFLAFSWASVTVALPLAVRTGVAIESHDILIFFQRFFFILTLSLLFDIRDIKYDRSEGVMTIAGTKGAVNVKVYAVASMMIFLSLTIFDQVYFWVEVTYWPAFFLSTAILLILIFISEPENPRWFYAGIIDSSTTLQFLMLLLLLFIVN